MKIKVKKEELEKHGLYCLQEDDIELEGEPVEKIDELDWESQFWHLTKVNEALAKNINDNICCKK